MLSIGKSKSKAFGVQLWVKGLDRAKAEAQAKDYVFTNVSFKRGEEDLAVQFVTRPVEELSFDTHGLFFTPNIRVNEQITMTATLYKMDEQGTTVGEGVEMTFTAIVSRDYPGGTYREVPSEIIIC